MTTKKAVTSDAFKGIGYANAMRLARTALRSACSCRMKEGFKTLPSVSKRKLAAGQRITLLICVGFKDARKRMIES